MAIRKVARMGHPVLREKCKPIDPDKITGPEVQRLIRDMFETMAKYNVFGIEMEAAGIFPIAAEYNAEALAIYTVSDDIPNGRHLTADERATTFDEMIHVALETAIAGG